jgi:hypothetical protein
MELIPAFFRSRQDLCYCQLLKLAQIGLSFHLFQCAIYAVAQLVKALRYKSDGRGFIFHISFSCNTALGLTKPLTELSIEKGFR